MRAFVLLGLSAFALAACDSPYGPPPSSASNRNYVTTGSHLKPSGEEQPSDVQTLGAGSLGNSASTGKVPGPS